MLEVEGGVELRFVVVVEEDEVTGSLVFVLPDETRV